MLRIKIELWPYGNHLKKQDIGEITIWNRGSGDSWRGNYGYKVHEDESAFFEDITEEGEINNHNRKQPALALLYKVLQKALTSIDNNTLEL